MRSISVNVGDTGTAQWADNLRDDAYGGSLLLTHQQTTPGMTLYVEPGTYYIGGTRVIFAGGNTPTFTAPVTHPRIDLVTADSSGSIAIVQGTEASTPVAPAYPANKAVLCEVYNVVGETALYDLVNETSGEGYISNDVRPILDYPFNPLSVASDIIPDATDTRNLGSNPGSSGNEWNNIYAKNIYASTIIQQDGVNISVAKFGGTGADGALSITSGTTTINLGGASVVVKNYTSISITGTGQLAFSNPAAGGTIIILKSQGNVTITSTAAAAIDASSMGSAGGASVSPGGGFPMNGNTGSGFSYFTVPSVAAGSGGSSTSPNGGGGGGQSNGNINANNVSFVRKAAYPGTGGGSGAVYGPNTGGSSGVGGIGGGAVYIECGGALNITSTFKSVGAAGAAGSANYCCGGGGGGGGMFVILYNTLTANTATFTVTGGLGGAAGGAQANAGNGGLNGFSAVVQNTEFS